MPYLLDSAARVVYAGWEDPCWIFGLLIVLFLHDYAWRSLSISFLLPRYVLESPRIGVTGCDAIHTSYKV